MALIESPADQEAGRLASGRTILSHSGYRILLYSMQRGGRDFQWPHQWQKESVNWLLVNSCSRAWEEGPTWMPDQWLNRPIIAAVCLNEVCNGEPGRESPL